MRIAAGVVVAAAAVMAVPLIGPTTAQAADLGGYTLAAEATPVAIQIFEPLIPIPAEPQLEVSLSYSRAKFSSGPSGRGVSSLLWAGDAVGYGLPELLQNPDATYPIKVDVAHPGGPADGKQELVPGTGMTAHADDKTIQASASIAKPALPMLPATGVPVSPMLVAVESFASDSVTTVSADKATAASYATAASITLLGGLVKINGLRAEATAVSDGSKGTTTGSVVWSSLTVVGQTFAVNQDGVTSPLGTTALPTLPAMVAKRLADFGLRIDAPKVTANAEDTGAAITGQGLTITLDTAVLKSKLDLGWLLDPFVALLPPDLRNQLTPWLGLAPKLVFILGKATSQATATPAFSGEVVAPPPLVEVAPVGGGSGSGSTGSTGDVPPAAASNAVAPVAKDRQWPVFPGVPWYLFVIGVGGAAAFAYALKRYVPMMLGATGCELGATGGIPNLRER